MIYWLILLIVCLVMEAATLGLTTIWFAGGALVAMVVALLGGPVWLQLLLFFVVSLVLVVFTRPIATKYFNRDRLKTNAESVVGQQAVVTVEIDNVKEAGEVLVHGQEWSARGVAEYPQIAKDTIVVVEAIEGVKLYVKPVEE
ncbi:MAG: NfeD family protein [Lachnospiraceae bacterium]|nr:NfeD family protein [Lachnospiraceae bacterium]